MKIDKKLIKELKGYLMALNGIKNLLKNENR